jgi:ubiquinone/menaquinone biosynthesis C-methylase UbiE
MLGLLHAIECGEGHRVEHAANPAGETLTSKESSVADTTSTASASAADWGSDFFGSLNELPPEPVTGIGHILEAMATLPAFRDARQWLLQNLGISQGSSVFEAGCGTGAAVSDVLSIVGKNGRVTGNDPTKTFVESARARAEKLGASNARYEVGDIRSIPADDGEFDAAFCDKVLIHAGPAKAALSEMARVTRSGGHVGAIEWLPFFALSSNQPEALDAFNAIFRKACYDYFVSLNLARHFHFAGLKDVRTGVFLAHADNLDAHPFWRAFIVQQMPMFIHAGLINEPSARAFLADLEALNNKGEFSVSFIVQAAVGRN